MFVVRLVRSDVRHAAQVLDYRGVNDALKTIRHSKRRDILENKRRTVLV